MIEMKEIIEVKATRRPSKATQGILEPEDKGNGRGIFEHTRLTTTENIDKIIDQMVARWPSPVVGRKAIGKFSGGILSPKTMANEDCNGTGPEGRFLLMNQIVYPVDSVIAWLKSRSAKSWKERKAVR